jgi:hypothetical protein
MNEVLVEFFLHGSGEPRAVSGRPEEVLKDVLVRLDAAPADGQFVFVGEALEEIRSPEAEEDTHQPVDVELTLKVLDISRHKHVHTRAVRRVEVIVFFNANHHKHRFSPAATVTTVTSWAKKRFGIDPAAGADMVLAQRPSGSVPRPDEHLGELLAAGSHVLEFDLVSEVTPQG